MDFIPVAYTLILSSTITPIEIIGFNVDNLCTCSCFHICSDSQAVTLWNEGITPSYENLEVKVVLLTRELGVFGGIVSDSQGVAGYHQNGDIAGWDELLSDMESL